MFQIGKLVKVDVVVVVNSSLSVTFLLVGRKLLGKSNLQCLLKFALSFYLIRPSHNFNICCLSLSLST